MFLTIIGLYPIFTLAGLLLFTSGSTVLNFYSVVKLIIAKQTIVHNKEKVPVSTFYRSDVQDCVAKC